MSDTPALLTLLGLLPSILLIIGMTFTYRLKSWGLGYLTGAGTACVSLGMHGIYEVVVLAYHPTLMELFLYVLGLAFLIAGAWRGFAKHRKRVADTRTNQDCL